MKLGENRTQEQRLLPVSHLIKIGYITVLSVGWLDCAGIHRWMGACRNRLNVIPLNLNCAGETNKELCPFPKHLRSIPVGSTVVSGLADRIVIDY